MYDEIRCAADLPVGWTDEQNAGHYRLRRREDEALFGYAVGPHSWKKYQLPAETKLWEARVDQRGGLAEITERAVATLQPTCTSFRWHCRCSPTSRYTVGRKRSAFSLPPVGAGVVPGGLLLTTLEIIGPEPWPPRPPAFGVAITAGTASPTLATDPAMVLVGAPSTVFMATGNSTLQPASDPSFRGRVMALCR